MGRDDSLSSHTSVKAMSQACASCLQLLSSAFKLDLFHELCMYCMHGIGLSLSLVIIERALKNFSLRKYNHKWRCQEFMTEFYIRRFLCQSWKQKTQIILNREHVTQGTDETFWKAGEERVVPWSHWRVGWGVMGKTLFELESTFTVGRKQPLLWGHSGHSTTLKEARSPGTSYGASCKEGRVSAAPSTSKAGLHVSAAVAIA